MRVPLRGGPRPAAGRLGRLPLWVAAALVMAGCSPGRPLPPAGELLGRAAASMREVRTVSFALTVEGRVGSLGIRRAEGVLTRSGDAAGTVLVEQAGTAIEYEVVIARGTYYLKGPTGGFRALPPALSRAAYNPAGLLGPEGGLAGLLARAREARTVAAEAVRGTGAFRVVARVDAGPVGQLVPLPAGARSVAADLWVGGEPPRLLRVRVAAAGAGDAGRSVLEVTLGEFDAPVTVTPPPT